VDESLTSPTPSYCRAGSTAEPKTWGWSFPQNPPTRRAGLAEALAVRHGRRDGSAGDTLPLSGESGCCCGKRSPSPSWWTALA